MFETTNAFLSESWRDGEKPLSYLKPGEKKLSESHTFLSETKKVFCAAGFQARSRPQEANTTFKKRNSTRGGGTFDFVVRIALLRYE